ncbi:MAG: HupE/UreJ family protein [Pacificimonas sp.]|jgi:hypothetical protein|nr:HupE/UreJ family protein [Pacificimonas sp.]
MRWTVFAVAAAALLASPVLAHDVSAANAAYVEGLAGPAPVSFLYLGAKHMVTGIDHVLFLLGVVFFLRNLRDIVIYVSLFTLGHSLTLITGVLAGWQVNPFLVDAIIGVSVVYKAFENIGGFDKLSGAKLDMRWAVFAFGLAHGLGLATKLQALTLSEDGLLTNLLSFNLGVEIGQVLVLCILVALLKLWQRAPAFPRQAYAANAAIMCAGFVLIGLHLTGMSQTA